MNIVICGSMMFSEEMIKTEEKLIRLGHQVTIPRFTKEYAKLDKDKVHSESVRHKLEHELIKDYYFKIKDSDAILVINEPKNEIENYIGGNSLIEMGFAYITDKKIYLLNGIPQMNYTDEIVAMQPICLKGDLEDMLKGVEQQEP